MQHQDNRPIETIRLSDKDKAKLLNQIEQGSARAVPSERRALRLKFTTTGTVVKLHQPNGMSSRLSVLPRNLSKRGLAFIHGRFVYPGVKAEVTLPTVDGELVTVSGVVRNCRHVSGIVHEVAVVFDDLIDLALFVEMTPEEELTYRKERAEDLGEVYVEEVEAGDKAKLMLAEAADTDRKLYRLWLTKAGLEVVEAVTAEDATRQASAQPFDVAIINAEAAGVGEESGLDLIKALRAAEFTVPIIALVNNASGPVADAAMQAGCESVLAKPFQAPELEQAVSQLTVVGESDDPEPLRSSSADDPDMAPLLVEYVEGLSAQVQELRSSLSSQDWDTLEKITQNLKGSSGGYGFEPISTAAQGVLETLAKQNPPDLESIRGEADALIALLRRAKA